MTAAQTQTANTARLVAVLRDVCAAWMSETGGEPAAEHSDVYAAAQAALADILKESLPKDFPMYHGNPSA